MLKGSHTRMIVVINSLLIRKLYGVSWCGDTDSR